jgi:hypothetical protein
MGYLGGPRADRAWTLPEWLAFAHLRQFPIYVPDLARDPIGQGAEAALLALRLGWSGSMREPQTRVIVLDMETSANAKWYDGAATTIIAHGFLPIAYGSLSTVMENAANDVLAADWNDVPALPPGQDIHGVQNQANITLGNTTVDYCLFDEWLFQRGGVGPRRHVPVV